MQKSRFCTYLILLRYNYSFQNDDVNLPIHNETSTCYINNIDANYFHMTNFNFMLTVKFS